MPKILVTGAAGFIGFHLSLKLLERGDYVTGLDNLNDYYDTRLKKARLNQLTECLNFSFSKLDLEDRKGIKSLFDKNNFDIVINLAARVGVRNSLKDPHNYVDSNIVGFVNLIEECRKNNIKHFIFASSSSVYGANKKLPFSVHQNVDHPISLYAASKKANELIAHSYAHLYKLPCTGLRFFTVYGPWGRPDMSYFIFTKAILENRPIEIFNNGMMKRDFTYIDDVIKGVVMILGKTASPNMDWSGESPDPSSSCSPYKIYNIGSNNAIGLMTFIETIENILDKKAKKIFRPMQNGDVTETFANLENLIKDFEFQPKTSIENGINEFVNWYRKFYQV